MANIDQRHRPPKVTPLYGGRIRVEYTYDAKNYLDTKGEMDATVFLAPKTADGKFATCYIVAQGLAGADPGAPNQLVRTFETLTSSLVDAVRPRYDTELNGLRRVTRKLIGFPDIDWQEDFVEGTTELEDGNGEILASVKDDSDEYATRLTVTYLEPGVVSKGEQPGPVPGTTEHTWQTWLLDATDSTEMGGAENTIPGVLIAKNDGNFQGYKVRNWTSVGGTITGVKYTYTDVEQVRVPGTVELTTQAVTAGDLTGTIAVAKVTPPKTKSVEVTVSVEITTTPPSTATIAYDLGAISCAVNFTHAAFNYRGFDSMSTISGDLTESAPRRSASIGARHIVYPECYLIGTSATGTFTYTAGTQFTRSSGGSIVSGTPLTSTETNTVTGTGSTSAAGYLTTGVIRRPRARPVFTAHNGTTYYEVTTWTV